eukprot:CAMPEP_0197040404 /NCGR_PEP_ID=MMETSP1384-20130603/17106_1 /TAXON_ID=29189 /ORGANISM="Ammonia sp." /LENGTH=648 /DNA_ID=CAMNT_0042471153 /DNA_START=30 /DNA_END=1976 /DNA_ORIENTATION=-
MTALTARKVGLFFMAMLLICSVAIEMVAFKSTATAFPFSACFIICVFCFGHSMLCFIICLYKIYAMDKYDVSMLSSFPIARFIPLGLLRSLGISVIFVSVSREVAGSLLVILLQIQIPLSVVLSRFIKSISYKSISKAHWVAIALSFISVVFGFLSSYLGHLGSNYIDYSNNNNAVNAWWYIPVVLVSCLMQSLFILYQETKLKQQYEEYPSELINAWISLLQCVCSFVLTPITIYLGDPEMHFWDDWTLFLHQGFLCLFSDTVDDSMFCPHGNAHSILQFCLWLTASIAVLLLTNYATLNLSPLISRFCILLGLLGSIIMFQSGFPSLLIVNGQSDYFDECLLLGILCSFVGSFMLLIDFNPSSSNTLLDAIQFDELNYSKQIKKQLLMLQKQHQSLTMSQSQINLHINHNHNCVEPEDEDAVHDDIYLRNHCNQNNHINININNNNSSSPPHLHSHSHASAHSLSPPRHPKSRSFSDIPFAHSANLSEHAMHRYHHDNNGNDNDYVHYLLMEQQKEMIKQEYQSKLQQYQQAEKQRSRSFHEEFYSMPQAITMGNDQSNSSKKKAKKQRKKKKSKKYYMNQQQIEEYYLLLQREHDRRKQQQQLLNDTDTQHVFEATHFHIANPLMDEQDDYCHDSQHTDSVQFHA